MGFSVQSNRIKMKVKGLEADSVLRSLYLDPWKGKEGFSQDALIGINSHLSKNHYPCPCPSTFTKLILLERRLKLASTPNRLL